MNNSGAFNADIFAKNLREARKNKNWTQNQLAEEVNKKGFSIRGATIATYEARDHKKRRQPSMDKAIAIAEALATAASRLAAGDIIRFVSIVFLLSVSNFGLSVTDLYSVYHRLVTTWSQIEKICTHLTDFLRGEVNIKMMIKIK